VACWGSAEIGAVMGFTLVPESQLPPSVVVYFSWSVARWSGNRPSLLWLLFKIYICVYSWLPKGC
jgi:hypothetical protein